MQLKPHQPLLSLTLTLSALAGGMFLGSALLSAHAYAAPPAHVTLNGVRVEVRWSDGDSLRFLSGSLKGGTARLMGYNTLESYGPVHKWGEWSEWELYKLAKGAKDYAAREAWSCEIGEEKDHYGRHLMRCPELTKMMLKEGVGHLFEVDSDPTPELVALQQEAIKAQRGMWAKGAPEGLVTSLHSSDEHPDVPAYNRVANLKTGRAVKHLHTETYKTCQWVCLQGSCALYVPFKQRYGKGRAACLQWKKR